MHNTPNHNKAWPQLEGMLRETCKTSQPSNPTQLNWVKAMQILPELGRLYLVPPDQFVRGDVQTYYEQGYNYQDHQYQTPAED
jgi:hypothetical protein